MGGRTVAFHSGQLGVRGSEVALWDYAHWNEVILGNRSLVLCPASAPQDGAARFRERFPVILYDDRDGFADADRRLAAAGAECLYAIKPGFRDHVISRVCRTAVHVTFPNFDPHGDAYAYVSPWLAKLFSGGTLPVVPHIVHLPEVAGDLRDELGIPPGAVVFGRHGGWDSFDIPFARDTVAAVATACPDRWFVFLHTEPFCAPRPNVIHLPATSDVARKARFIQTCDAMLHARRRGETFGLAIAEFSCRNKPVLTYGDRDRVIEQAHLDFLGDRALRYVDAATLEGLLRSFEPAPDRDWNAFRAFTPGAVMHLFANVFLA